MKVLNRSLDIQLCAATILKVNNYEKPNDSEHKLLPFNFNRSQTDIVFQLKDSDKTLSLSVNDLQFPLYIDQEVDIISANQFIIGFVDVKSEEYYYLTNDFCKAAGLKFLESFTWFAGILASVMILRVTKNMYAPVYAITLLTFTWTLNIIMKEVFNRKIENAIDERMQAFSLF
jgi:hypothetical protein